MNNQITSSHVALIKSAMRWIASVGYSLPGSADQIRSVSADGLQEATILLRIVVAGFDMDVLIAWSALLDPRV